MIHGRVVSWLGKVTEFRMGFLCIFCGLVGLRHYLRETLYIYILIKVENYRVVSIEIMHVYDDDDI